MSLKNLIKKLLKKHKRFKKFLIALSGGVDSIVLLNQFFLYKKKKNIQIRAIYIDHNLTNISKTQKKHCKKICKNYKIYFFSISIILKNIKKYGLEASARLARYDVFKKFLKKKEILVTAHHLNDQCETFFLALKRKSGITGLSSMKILIPFFHTFLMRPFLQYLKKDILKIALKNKLSWIEDETNQNIKYERNFIRHKILPIFQNKWSYFLKNCYISIKILEKERKILLMLLQKKLKKYLDINKNLNLNLFSQLKSNFQNSLLRLWILEKKHKNIPFFLIQNIQEKFLKNYNLLQKKIIYKNFLIYNKKNILIFTKKNICVKNIILLWKKPYKKILLPYDLGSLYISYNQKYSFFPYPSKNTVINIRFIINGKFYVSGNNKKKTIQDIWQDYKIPIELRHNIPLIFYNQNLIGGIGVFYCPYDQKKIKKKISFIWSTSTIKKKNNNKNYHIQSISYNP
ncbi:tRNA lysidine(34) synthetase TilS [Buchnera aphidicola]|uniref:tRNA lysidine(34) synthetase TilS n=1 Tax=Buchnera aphidicola TaxID=9 RepID=UPI0031B82333